MFGYGLWLRSAIFGWGFWCVWVGVGVCCIPLLLAGVLGRVSPCTRSVLVGLPVAWGCVGVARGGVSRPLAFFFCGLPGCRGGGLWVRFLALLCLALLWSPSPVSVLGPGLRPPSPCCLGFFCFFFAVSASVWPVPLHFSCGVCAGVSGVSFPPALRRPGGRVGPLLLAWCLLLLFLLLSSLGWCKQWLAFRMANRVAVSVLGGCGLSPGPMGWLGYVHAWAGGLSCQVRCWFCRLGGCASRFCGVMG